MRVPVTRLGTSDLRFRFAVIGEFYVVGVVTIHFSSFLVLGFPGEIIGKARERRQARATHEVQEEVGLVRPAGGLGCLTREIVLLTIHRLRTSFWEIWGLLCPVPSRPLVSSGGRIGFNGSDST
jgi:hypothetical protein